MGLTGAAVLLGAADELATLDDGTFDAGMHCENPTIVASTLHHVSEERQTHIHYTRSTHYKNVISVSQMVAPWSSPNGTYSGASIARSSAYRILSHGGAEK